ncbi:MAG: co-chaperone GroES [Chlorobiota bacterium]
MKLTPLYDRVVVKPAPPEEVTKGGIIIPDTAKEKPQQGEVVAVGKGKLTEDGKLIPLQVKVGDQVLFGKYAGTEITIDGEEYLIMRESDIYAIVNTEAK